MKTLTIVSTFIIFTSAFAISSNAQIIYTDVIPDSTIISVLPDTTVYLLDLNNDNIKDFKFTSIVSQGCSGHINRNCRITPLDSNSVAGTYAYFLNANDSIDSSAVIWAINPNSIINFDGWILYPGGACIHQSFGYWNLPYDGYIGLQLKLNNQYYFGWALLSGDASVIKEYAYDSIPNQTILAGQTGPPFAYITGNASICPGDSTALTVIGGTSFLWSNGETSSSVMVNPAITTTYNVLVNDSILGYTLVLTRQIIVNNVNLTVTQPNCNKLILTPTPLSNYQWYECSTWNPVNLYLGTIPLNPGYYAAIISLNGCVDTTSCYYASAIFFNYTGATICLHDSITLSVINGDTFLWSTGETTSSITKTPQSTTIYSVAVTDLVSGCTTIFSQQINVKSVVTLTNFSGDTIFAFNGFSYVYQWFDCNTHQIIPGATNYFFVPGINGNYAAAIYSNGCADTTACVNIIGLGINEVQFQAEISIYPDPAINSIAIKISSMESGEIQIVNFFGRVVETHNYASLRDATLQIDITRFPAGMYMVRWISGENYETKTFSVIK